MKRKMRFLILSTLLTLLLAAPVQAKVGDMGFFGGINEGRKLPKTTETLLADTGKRKTTTDQFVYKELLVVGGAPVEFEGTVTVRDSENIPDDENSGTYKMLYTIAPLATTDDDASLRRRIEFNVNWRREGKQIIKDYEVNTWVETITVPDGEYTLDRTRSNFSVSIIEDHTPGVVYSKGNMSITAVYVMEGDGEGADAAITTVQSTGTLYGYESAWSSTETQRMDTWVFGDGWQMQYQIRPSVAVNKTLQYTQNEPTAISFDGNYMDVIANKSSLTYDIFVKPNFLYALEDTGSFNIPTYNSFEQLIAPDTTFLKGHFAEYDINRLFSMQVLDGEPRFYQPDQAMTRGEYVMALAKAIKLPIEDPQEKSSRRSKKTLNIVFPDVQPERKEYPYIMAAFNANLAIGRDTGNFYIDAPIERQEAITIMVRILGLENLGLNPTPITPFTDDRTIADWAKREVSAANTLNLISGDVDGNFRPTENLSKAEGAALINRLIEYMRHDMVTDYSEHIIGYTS